MKKLNEILKKYGVELSGDALKEVKESFVPKSDLEAEQSRYSLLKEAYDKTELNHAIKVAIIKSGAKSEKALEGFIDRSKIAFENGELSGFSEQLEAIKKENDYLFDCGKSDTGALHSGISSADTDKMTDEEYYAYALNNKE